MFSYRGFSCANRRQTSKLAMVSERTGAKSSRGRSKKKTRTVLESTSDEDEEDDDVGSDKEGGGSEADEEDPLNQLSGALATRLWPREQEERWQAAGITVRLQVPLARPLRT